MAGNTKKNRAKTKAPRINGHSLFYILSSLIVTTILLIIVTNYNLKDVNNEPDVDPKAEALSFNLDEASKPFDGSHFIDPDNALSKRPIWGSLNSGQYFGLKMSTPKSVEYGTMWFANQLNRDFRLSIRHLCDQNDNLKFYAWTRHDFYSFGEQTIIDGDYQFNTSYVVQPENRLNWNSRITFDYLGNKTKLQPISLVQYITTNRQSDHISVETRPSNPSNTFVIKGYSEELGEFTLSIKYNSTISKPLRVNYIADYVRKDSFTLSSFLGSKLRLNYVGGKRLFELSDIEDEYSFDTTEMQSNIIAYQIIINSPGTLYIEFRQKDTLSNSIDHETLLQTRTIEFDQKFSKKFPLNYTSFPEAYHNELDRLAMVALSNMLGGVGYFYGNSFINSPKDPNKVIPYGPIQLLTGVPSRSFFPRGFLWDEGFHNLLVSQWDAALSNSIIQSWFDIMNVNGWMPREVILGFESIRRVPHEFVVQSITNANPPSMFLTIESMFVEGSLDESTLEAIYPRLKAWFKWFNVTQSGIKPSTYRWRGRDELSVNMLNPKTLTSGLDDYPRSSHPSPHEYHIDLRCWMARSARTLAKLSKKMQDLEYHKEMSNTADILYDNSLLDDLHWSEANKMYCDFGYNTEKAELVEVTKVRQSSRDPTRQETYKALERHSTGHPKFECVPEFGYVSLFPLLFNILDHRSDKLGILLDRIRDENELWSPFGVRSLSKASRYYNKKNTEHDNPYWRGAVWLNINYLILSSLKSYSKLDGPYKDKSSLLFVELKTNLANNVLKEFSRTNYIWENYDDATGRGKGSHPFTGWSSLILLIMSSHLD